MFDIPEAGLHLRALRAALDLDSLLSLENHADIAVWASSTSPIPKGATWKDMAHKGLELQTEMACIIETLPSTTGGGPNGDQPTPAAFVGVAVLWVGPDRGHRHARYTTTLAPEYWGKGYATKVTQFMVDYAFSNLNLHRISLEVRDGNKAAIRVYEKCGFVHEGRQRKVKWQNGEWKDVLVMGILSDDPKQAKEVKGQ